ncbi:MAG: hypothetical protein RAO94_10650 [Candidatus Stygibacter australis]|nr:hypothetical protein [Candidatus Stygibacter australis]
MINVYKPFGGHLGFRKDNDVFISGGLFGQGRKIGEIKGNDIYSIGVLFGKTKLGYVSGNYVYTTFGSLFGASKVGVIVGKDIYDTNRNHLAHMDAADPQLGAATILLLIK